MKTKIETPRFYLERLEIKHISQSYVNWMNDEEVIRYLESGGNYTKADLSLYVIDVVKKDIYFWAIIDKKTNKHIGNIKIDPIDYKNKHGEYGILIGDKTFWGMGVGFEISDAIIRFCFEGELKLMKINLGVRSENKTAIRLYEKLGFKIEEVLKIHTKTKSDFGNVFRMSLINPIKN
jgi:ribosomal-protein-alanine N-acetyltransferase